MNNRPYICDSANVQNENWYQTVPTQYGLQNLLVTHGQHKNIVDRTTTSIQGQQQQLQQQQQQPQCYNFCTSNQHNLQPPSCLYGQKQMIPGGVTFTFSPMAQNCAARNVIDVTVPNNQNITNFCQQPLTLQQQMAINTLQRNAIQSMLLEEQYRRDPFKLMFHSDGQTDTADLVFDCPCEICGSTNTAEEPEEGEAEESYPEQTEETPEEQASCYEEKGIQFSPEILSVETQYNSTAPCICSNKHSTSDHQTETKKVSFDDRNQSRDPQQRTKAKTKRKMPVRRRNRSVDEDSSDSSPNTSQSSEEDE